LADDIAIEEVLDLARHGQVNLLFLGALVGLLGDDVVTQMDALVADVDRRPCDELLDLALALSAEGAAKAPTLAITPAHRALPCLSTVSRRGLWSGTRTFRFASRAERRNLSIPR